MDNLLIRVDSTYEVGMGHFMRSLALAQKWLNEKGVQVLCTPPSTLCELSYEAAQKEQFSFYLLLYFQKYSFSPNPHNQLTKRIIHLQ